ncbi:MAG: hypothetical protein GF393_04035 [Armatimonadia bacterium]|nr:hypothetical protein [Armatimonadia bacterium]
MSCLACSGNIDPDQKVVASDLCDVCRKQDLYICEMCGFLADEPTTNGDVEFCPDCGLPECFIKVWEAEG